MNIYPILRLRGESANGELINRKNRAIKIALVGANAISVDLKSGKIIANMSSGRGIVSKPLVDCRGPEWA